MDAHEGRIMAWGNDAQRETIEMLLSEIDCLEVAAVEDMAYRAQDAGVLVFDGQGVDGPSVGYIELDGKVTWIAGG